jgi:hypothetical protein
MTEKKDETSRHLAPIPFMNHHLQHCTLLEGLNDDVIVSIHLVALYPTVFTFLRAAPSTQGWRLGEVGICKRPSAEQIQPSEIPTSGGSSEQKMPPGNPVFRLSLQIRSVEHQE